MGLYLGNSGKLKAIVNGFAYKVYVGAHHRSIFNDCPVCTQYDIYDAYEDPLEKYVKTCPNCKAQTTHYKHYLRRADQTQNCDLQWCASCGILTCFNCDGPLEHKISYCNDCDELAMEYYTCPTCNLSPENFYYESTDSDQDCTPCAHQWSYELNWAKDFTVCYASATCGKCSSHVETQSNQVIQTEVEAATCQSYATMRALVSSWTKHVGPFVNSGIDINGDGMIEPAFIEYEDTNGEFAPHNWSDVEIDANTGYIEKYCVVCEESRPYYHNSDICGKFGFEEVTVEYIEPTCTEDGYIATKCSYCEELIKDFEVIPALGHTGGKATCMTQAVCTQCGKSYGDLNPAAHVRGYFTNQGDTHLELCDECGTQLSIPEPHTYAENGVCSASGCGAVNENGSDCEHEETSEMTRVDPTCGANGNIVYQCDICGYEFTESIPATGAHDWEAATCTAPKTCKICGAIEGEALDHDWADATCTKPKTCKREGCNETEGEALGHTDATDEAVDATCTTKGLTEGKHCSVCNEVIIEQKEIPALGHKEFEVAPAKEPTCTVAGHTSIIKCERCDVTLQGQQSIPALDHDWVVEGSVPATCGTYGYIRSGCSRCDSTYDAVIVDDPPTGEHTWGEPYEDDGTGETLYRHDCTVCDEYEYIDPEAGV